ncbi:MAG TPA: plasmid pRiA4b ORF-3 family protein [Leptolyngbyaceae cyanobacterium]
MNPSPSDPIYQLYVELVDSYPPIWRCFQVPASFTLAQLHTVMQVVMGWHGAYPHFFKVNGQRYGQVVAGETEDDLGDEGAIALSDVFSSETQPCFYTYDPQEGWLHRIELDEVLSAQPDQSYPCCIDGERACPPERSGGVWGYEEFLERLNDPDDPEYDALWEKAGQDFDPEKLNLEGVNQRLATLDLAL